METRSSNRICPTAVNPATSPLLNGRLHSFQPHKGGALRRRCRSETLPSTTTAAGFVSGLPTVEKIYGKLTATNQKHDAHQQQRSIVQSYRPVLQKYTPVHAVLRNQESVKHIFSCPSAGNDDAIRNQNQSGRVQTRQQHQDVFRKENIEATRFSGLGQYLGQTSSVRQARLQEFERLRDQQQQFVNTDVGSSPEKNGGSADVHQRSQRGAIGRNAWSMDGPKRRVRSLSECDPSELTAGCRSSPMKNGGGERYGTNDVSFFYS